MVYELEVPPPLARFHIDAHQALAKKIVSRSMATKKISSRTLNGQINQAEFLIDGDLGPDSRVAGVLCRAVQPAVITKLSLLGDGVKDPEALAGADIKGAHVSFVIAIADRSESFPKGGADNHDVFGHDRRRMQP